MLPLVVPPHHFLFMKLFPPPSSTMIPPPPWNLQQSEAVFFPREEPQQPIITLFEEPEQQQTLLLFEEADQSQQEITLTEEPQQRSLWPIEETQQQLPEQDLIFEELVTGEPQQHLSQRSTKPLQQRPLQQQPLVAIVFPHQQVQRPQHTTQSARIIDVPQNLESTIIESTNNQISNVELLRRHGIMDCSVIIGAFQPNEFNTTPLQARRKRKAERDPTYQPSRRICRQSIGWAETRELRNLPMREIRNLQDFVALITD